MQKGKTAKYEQRQSSETKTQNGFLVQNYYEEHRSPSVSSLFLKETVSKMCSWEACLLKTGKLKTGQRWTRKRNENQHWGEIHSKFSVMEKERRKEKERGEESLKGEWWESLIPWWHCRSWEDVWQQWYSLGKACCTEGKGQE